MVGKFFTLFELLLPKIEINWTTLSQKNIFENFILFQTVIYDPSTVHNWIKHIEAFFIYLIVKFYLFDCKN
jgi:hypothetical protein